MRSRNLKTILCLSLMLLFYASFSASQAQDTNPEVGIWAVEWNSQGTLLAAAHSDGKIYLYDQTGRLIQHLAGHAENASALAWSPDDTLLATGGWDAAIRIWDVESGTLVNEIETFPEGIFELAWQPTGEQLVAAGFDTLQAWDTRSWQPVAEPLAVSVLDISWSPTGSSFAIAATPRYISVISIQDGKFTGRSFAGHDFVPASVSWSKDGKQLISAGGKDGSVRLWDVETGEQVAVLLQTDDVITDAVFVDANGEQFVAITEEGNVYFVDTATQEIVKTLKHEAKLLSVAWNEQEQILALAGVPQDQNITDSESAESTGFLELISLSEES